MPRSNSPFLDVAIDAPSVKVLDHGFIRVVDYCGDELSIERAARQSYAEDPAARTPEERRALLRYLVRHRHTTPLEMCEIALQVKLPIFVARQWIRHRMANVNELSARYSVLDKEFYIPELQHLGTQSASNKQGRGDASVNAKAALTIMRRTSEDAFGVYSWLLADPEVDGGGVSRELARIELPLSTYTTWTWKCDLHNLLHFLSLRMDAHAQYEIRVYAEKIWRLVVGWVPVVAEAFTDYRLEALSFSKQELQVLRRMLPPLDRMTEYCNGSPLTLSDLPNKREREEFLIKLQKLDVSR